MASIEIMDLTGDDACSTTLGTLSIREGEEAKIPLIYWLDDDDYADADADDFLRKISPTEPARVEACQASQSSYSRTARVYLDKVLNQLGCSIEVQSDLELDGQEFMRVKKIFRDMSNDVYMEGILLVRTRAVMNMMPKKYNELCAMITAQVDSSGELPDAHDHLVTRPISSAICKRKIIFTNQHFPTHSFREASRGYSSFQDVEDNAELVCRYKYIEFCDTNWKVPSQALVRLRKHECDFSIPDAQLMLAWREDLVQIRGREKSEKTLRSAVFKSNRSHFEKTTSRYDQTIKRVDHLGTYEKRTYNTITERFIPSQSFSFRTSLQSNSRNKQSAQSPSDSHTYGDICCGAGGATTAARRAGLTASFALDFASDPCESLRLSVQEAKVLNLDIFTFCDQSYRVRAYMKVDVLHISFPCQVYSTAHTHPGKDDERNEATGYSVIPLLQKCKPRIVTFEQSPNITKQHHASFEALIHQIIEIGYSVRWKIVNFADTGNVQSRNRLFVIAACPGEPLPSFPKPTHGNGPGLRKFTTINHILRKVPRFVKPHMRETVTWRDQRERMPYNGDRPLRGAITCSGGGEGNLHPSGKRPFNLQELAQLQGFPASHEFVGSKSSILRQIGNAVPGKAATPFFEEIVKSMKRFDLEVEAHENEVIEIVD